MALREFLLLFFLVGLASTSVLRRNNIYTDSEKTSISVRADVEPMAVIARSTSADDGRGPEIFVRSDLGKRGSIPSTLSLRDGSDHGNRLAKRFVSPHDKRKFVMGLQSNILTSAFWIMDMWVEKTLRQTSIWRGDYSSDLWEEGVSIVPSYDKEGPHQPAWCPTDFVLNGVVGTAEVIVKFSAMVWASDEKCAILEMINFPTCTIAGANVPITSWSFNQA